MLSYGHVHFVQKELVPLQQRVLLLFSGIGFRNDLCAHKSYKL
jgi:hypothetical protein